MNQQYIIKSGSGYFLEFIGNSPYCVSDPVIASRFELDKANKIIKSMDMLGFGAELILLKYGKYQCQQHTNQTLNWIKRILHLFTI